VPKIRMHEAMQLQTSKVQQLYLLFEYLAILFQLKRTYSNVKRL
jgi:hypothetical protein